MTDRHRWIVDHHEENHTVIEVDGQGFFDVPRWLLPSGTRGDDVLAVTVEADKDRAVLTVVRDPDATARARSTARRAIERLSKRDPGANVDL
ncbi:MAG TPA: DUF3006 family protein [Gemmatimonadales bacterium]|nr:DUF3006 family protein [Gemmatimonadales bacterium]